MPEAAAAITWVDLPIPLPERGRPAAFSLGERALRLCNADGTPYVVEDRCPHALSSFEGGALEGCVLSCPLHGGKLDVRDGSPVALPIRRPAACYGVRAQGDGWQVGLPD